MEALDSFGIWAAAKVVEVQEEITVAEGRRAVRVRVHFRGWKATFDEWISVGAGRLRPLEAVAPGRGPRREPGKRRRVEARAAERQNQASSGPTNPTPKP